jgi:para-aminobenzoate synthetase component 1
MPLMPFSLPVGHSPESLRQLLPHYVAQFPYAAFLDSNNFADPYGRYEWIAAWSARPNAVFTLEKLKQGKGKWRFGLCSFELKNRLLSKVATTKPQTIAFPELAFFEPEVVIACERITGALVAEGKGIEGHLRALTALVPSAPEVLSPFTFHPDTTKSDYISTVEALRSHIKEGDCYEINYCREWKASGKLKNPAAWFERLMQVSPVPFGMLFRWDSTYVLSASPERFLSHRGGQLVTQPIKGTAPRGRTEEEDIAFAEALADSAKDRAENVMIVDLSRHDLYPSCEVDSVQVPELFAIKTYPLVHQMVSTITGRLSPKVRPTDAMLQAFPPGSMTGAPKVRVCQLIDQHERSARGIYSGAAGYFDPAENFDLNVVIRSLVYDDRAGKLSFHAGGAITWDSDPAAEYEETLVKAAVLQKLFGPDALAD